MANLSVAGEVILGRHVTELRERVHACSAWSDRFAVVDEILGRVLDADAAVTSHLDEAWRLLETSGGRIAVGKAAERVGWSRRHLGSRCELEFGLPPKTAARAIRFGRLTAHLRRSSGSDLAGAAAACGYCAQSHLTREFASMAGCTPRAWIAEEFPSVQDPAKADHDPGDVVIL